MYCNKSYVEVVLLSNIMVTWTQALNTMTVDLITYICYYMIIGQVVSAYSVDALDNILAGKSGLGEIS